MAWLQSAGLTGNDTGPPLLGAAALQRIFTAKVMERRSSWPEPSHRPPLERQWGLLGLGLCPLPRRRPAPRRESSLWACLESCSAEGTCRSVAFSQHHSRCLLRRDVCSAASLSTHVSYATFVPQELLQVPVTRLELGSGEPLRVYAYATSVVPMVKAFVSSLELAGDGATLLLHHGGSDEQATYWTNQTRSRLRKPWPRTAEDHVDMQRRDRQKVNMVVRSIWDGLGSGAKQVLLTDVDVQVFPGWAQLVRACTSAAPVCVQLRPGLYDERTWPFNSGFLAFRADSTALAFALKLAAQYEAHFSISDPKVLMHAYPVEQAVLARFLSAQGAWFWAVFNPEYVRTLVDNIPEQILRLKVQHACATRTNRLKSMYRVRRLYYSSLTFCAPPGELGPQHPCCAIYGHQRSVFLTGSPSLPPFARGSIYGSLKDSSQPAPGLQGLVEQGLFGSSAEQWDYWGRKCESERQLRMHDWQRANPLEDFMNGQVQPLPSGLG